jgi:hypothetical protein
MSIVSINLWIFSKQLKQTRDFTFTLYIIFSIFLQIIKFLKSFLYFNWNFNFNIYEVFSLSVVPSKSSYTKWFHWLIRPTNVWQAVLTDRSSEFENSLIIKFIYDINFYKNQLQKINFRMKFCRSFGMPWRK